MNYNDEEKKEYELMYQYVMRNRTKELHTKDDIIEYLVTQCYFIDLYNDQLQDKIKKIMNILFISSTEMNDLPF